jgi:hypothetical protein
MMQPAMSFKLKAYFSYTYFSIPVFSTVKILQLRQRSTLTHWNIQLNYMQTGSHASMVMAQLFPPTYLKIFSFRESFPNFETFIIVLSQPPLPEMLSNSSQHPCWSHQTSELNSMLFRLGKISAK